jgi:hypothetical protein
MSKRFGFTTLTFAKVGDGTYAITGIRSSNGKPLVRYFTTLENAYYQMSAWDANHPLFS